MQPGSALTSVLARHTASLRGIFQRFSGSHPLEQHGFSIEVPGNGRLNWQAGSWRWQCQLRPLEGQPGAFDLTVQFTLESGRAPETSVGIELAFADWSSTNYVLLPAAVYAGNRFEALAMKYPPIFKTPRALPPGAPPVISDVPRLNAGPGPSRIQQLTRDLATPAIGFHSPANGQGFWLLTEQATTLGDSGITLEENADRSHAVIRVTAPGMRWDERYTICNTHLPCNDRGADFNPGDSVTLHLRLYFFDCPRLPALFARFIDIRKDLAGPTTWKHQLPFSAAWQIQEEKYNRDNWDETYGYYAVGIRDEFRYSHWQTGWVGGLMSTYPLLAQGSARSRERALRTFDFIFAGGQDQSGLLHGCGKEGRWFGDNFDNIDLPWVLIRKNSDALYFLLKQWLLLARQDPAWVLPAHWAAGTRRLADALVRLWQRYGQFGQFVDTHTGEIVVGGSASAAIAPAGLALASQYFNNPAYLAAAQSAGQFFYEQFVQNGYTTGGPGEILQCPDSESAFGLLESFIVLYEVTGLDLWLQHAIEQAHQCFTWCVSYDFHFPPDSTFGRFDMRTLGSVYANVQNKHSAPGICTLSGDALFKLFRATGDRRYLELVREMAHNMPQYLSRADRPISGMPSGWMNERVEMSDWLEPVGEIFYGSCWCEVSNMLAYIEIPGLYAQVDTGVVCAIDHIDVSILEHRPGELRLAVTNPTAFPAEVKVLAETSAQAAHPLGQNALLACQNIFLQPGETLTLICGEPHPDY